MTKACSANLSLNHPILNQKIAILLVHCKKLLLLETVINNMF